MAPLGRALRPCATRRRSGKPETDPLPSDSNVTYVGPILWQKKGAEVPEWIIHRDRTRPLIWVYSGNPRYGSGGGTLDSFVVLKASIAALRGLDVQVVLTTGHHELPRELLPLPVNCRHEAYLPGLAMADHAELLIHHGGYGSRQTGLFAGKPAVIMPTFSERESNARRVAALGAAIVVPVEIIGGRKHVNPDILRQAVNCVLGNSQYLESARRQGVQLRRYGGAQAAGRLIGEFAARRHGYATVRASASDSRENSCALSDR